MAKQLEPFKLIGSEVNSSTSVLNLSSFLLNRDQITLLSKGLNFIPKPQQVSKKDIMNAIKEFKRRLKLVAHFGTDSLKKPPDPLKLLLKPKSTWEPDDNNMTDYFCSQLKTLKKLIRNMDVKQNNRNLLKPNEIKALKSLKKNKNIIIKPADKGATVVVMDKDSYINEGERQLSDNKYYRRLEQPIHPTKRDTFTNILENIQTKKLLTEKEVENLEPSDNPRERRFYLLPKIHKEQEKWNNNMPPGRPIVSDCNSDTYKIAQYIDHFLSPLAISHPSYIKDTTDLQKKLSQIEPPANSFLITLDVESLYTNIDNTKGIEAVKETFLKHPQPKRPDEEIIQLLTHSLENNDFVFNDQWFLQTGGTAMGKRFAPNYANIFLAKWESEALKKCPKQPHAYFRFLDDIFIIWPHSLEDFDIFFQTLNSHESNIKLKSTISDKCINFLDVTIYKGQQFLEHGTLDTKVFFKPTDTHDLLHKSSYHPKHTFRSVVKSQLIRYHRICTHKKDFDEACTTLFTALKNRGYSKRFLRKIKQETILESIPKGGSQKCNRPRCKTCTNIIETKTIINSNNLPIALQHNLNCQSENIVYMIQCSNCKIRYVGETSCKLKDRINQHRSDIKMKKDTAVSRHFNQDCPNINYLNVIPLESVKRQGPHPDTVNENDSISTQIRRSRLIHENRFHLLTREQCWIKRLKTLQPKGLNIRTELGPPIPLVLYFSDDAPNVTKQARIIFEKLRANSTCFWPY